MENDDLRTLVPILEESALTKTEFLQTMRQTKARTAPPAPPPNPVAAALRRAGISTNAPYYAGAFQVVERAVKAAKKAARRPEQNEYRKDCPDTTAAARRFWQAYLLSLCGHLKQLEREAEPEDKPQERQLLRGGIRTVQAVLYALQETERTENEPRETA